MKPYYQLELSDTQLSALRSIYYKYFHSLMPQTYSGLGVIAIWKDANVYKNNPNNAKYPHTTIFSEECHKDPLWQEFSKLLPYMKCSATITKMPGNSEMVPHIDRAWRPTPIYFPILNCTDLTISSYYDNDLVETHRYSISTNAVVTDISIMHGVKNTSSEERIAFGWNSLSADISYSEFVGILHNLGYIKEIC